MDKFFSFPKPPSFFTDRKKVKDFAKIIEFLPENSAIIIREYDLDQKNREEFARKIIKLKGNKPLKILIGKDMDLAKKLNADGIHFSDFSTICHPRAGGDPTALVPFERSLPDKKVPGPFFQKRCQAPFLLSFAAHSMESIDLALKLKADMIFIAPAFTTTSHPASQPLGEKKLAEIAVKYKNLNNLYPLGGINADNIAIVKKLGFSSFGAIDFFNNL